MDPTELHDVLRTVLEQVPAIELAYLFGSQASGNARWNSDIDLAVRCNERLSTEQRMALISAVAEATGRTVDVVDLFETPEPVTGEVLGGKRLIGDEAAHARMLTRHLMAVADFLPLRKRILDERRARWIR